MGGKWSANLEATNPTILKGISYDEVDLIGRTQGRIL